MVRAAPIFQLMPDHLWRLGFRDDSVLTALEQHDGYVGIDPTGFCGRSMRIGALTAGVIAGTPEAVLYLQPGHGQFKAGRVYMHDFSAATLYATSRALGL